MFDAILRAAMPVGLVMICLLVIFLALNLGGDR